MNPFLGVFLHAIGGFSSASFYVPINKERQLTEAQKKEAVKDFSFAKGFAFATFGGIISSCMAFIIIFSNLWGVVLHEWRLVDRRTRVVFWVGMISLIASTALIGYGNSLAPKT